MRSFVLVLVTAGAVTGLAACAPDAPANPDPEVVRTQQPPIQDTVATVLDTVQIAPPETDGASVPDARPPEAPAASLPPSAERRSATRSEARIQTVAVAVTAAAFEPSRVALDAGAPARIVFTRTSDKTCATQVVFPSLGIGPVDLPLGEPVTIDVPANGPGEIAFACGMDMLRGSLVIGS